MTAGWIVGKRGCRMVGLCDSVKEGCGTVGKKDCRKAGLWERGTLRKIHCGIEGIQ
jgi:hypothetical protein